MQAAKAAETGKKDDRSKKSGSPSGKRSKSPGKKKGKKEADLPPSPKKDTKMRKRGDIEDTFKTIGRLENRESFKVYSFLFCIANVLFSGA